MKKWWQLLLCILLAAVIWLVHNMSQEYSDIISVPVIAKSNIDGRAEYSSGEVAVVARCRTTGWHLLVRSQNAVVVEFASSDLVHVGKDSFEIDESVLPNYSRQIFGQEIIPESFISSSVKFEFKAENNKKVPVEAIRKITYKPEYTASSITIVPDSVLVYGAPDVLKNIDKVLTDPVVLNDISKTKHGIAKVMVPSGVRASEDKVAYTVNVTRFVDICGKISIGARRVPSGKTFYVIPSEADVTFRCVFPLRENPMERVDLYVDYNEFVNSRTGKCVVHNSDLPEDVIALAVYPEVCDCVEGL